jgi:hypothetical protein
VKCEYEPTVAVREHYAYGQTEALEIQGLFSAKVTFPKRI